MNIICGDWNSLWAWLKSKYNLKSQRCESKYLHGSSMHVNVAWGHLRMLRAPFISCLVQMCQKCDLFVQVFLTWTTKYFSLGQPSIFHLLFSKLPPFVIKSCFQCKIVIWGTFSPDIGLFLLLVVEGFKNPYVPLLYFMFSVLNILCDIRGTNLHSNAPLLKCVW